MRWKASARLLTVSGVRRARPKFRDDRRLEPDCRRGRRGERRSLKCIIQLRRYNNCFSTLRLIVKIISLKKQTVANYSPIDGLIVLPNVSVGTKHPGGSKHLRLISIFDEDYNKNEFNFKAIGKTSYCAPPRYRTDRESKSLQKNVY